MSSSNNNTTTAGSDPTLTITGAVENSNTNIITSTSSFAREHLQKLALSDTRKLTTMISALDQDRHVGLLSVIACYIDGLIYCCFVTLYRQTYLQNIEMSCRPCCKVSIII